jgi:hypothetical protein
MSFRTTCSAIGLLLITNVSCVGSGEDAEEPSLDRQEQVKYAGRKAPSFFPEQVFYKRPELHKFKASWYTDHLEALKEPSIFASRIVGNTTTYRFLYLRTFDNPIAVRIEVASKGSSGILYYKQCNGAGGYAPGKLMKSKSVILDERCMETFVQTFENAGIWQMESEDQPVAMADGAQWVIEVLDKGRYHIVDRCSDTMTKIYNLCMLMLKMAQEKIDEIY